MILLLVEDDDRLRRALERALAADFEVRSCSTGSEGLDALLTQRVDVLLTDLDLPGTNGETLAQVARALPSPVPVVIMCGHPGRLEASRPLADEVIAKPFLLALLKAALHRALGSGGLSGEGGPILRVALAMAVMANIACAASTTAPAGDVDLLRGRWALEQIEKAGGPVAHAPSGASFTAVFEPEGGLALQADCNRCHAVYTAEAGTIMVGDRFPCTRAACPSAPFDHDYVTLVSSAKQWSVEGGRLELRSAAGRAVFHR